MSIESMKQTYKVYESKRVRDKFEAYTDEEVYVRNAVVTINQYASNANFVDVRYAEVTHFGLTKDRGLKQGQTLVSSNGDRYYIHLPVNNITRYSQLFLKRVEDYE